MDPLSKYIVVPEESQKKGAHLGQLRGAQTQNRVICSLFSDETAKERVLGVVAAQSDLVRWMEGKKGTNDLNRESVFCKSNRGNEKFSEGYFAQIEASLPFFFNFMPERAVDLWIKLADGAEENAHWAAHCEKTGRLLLKRMENVESKKKTEAYRALIERELRRLSPERRPRPLRGPLPLKSVNG